MNKDLDKMIEDKANEAVKDLANRYDGRYHPKIVGVSWFKEGAKLALTPEVLKEVPMVKALLKYAIDSRCEDEIFTDVCGHPHLRHGKTCSKCEVLAPFQESGDKND